jgi:hypothetical protein
MNPLYPYIPDPVLYCVCGKALPDGPYIAQQTENLGLIYISFAHPRCLAEWDWEPDDSELGAGHLHFAP